MAPAPDDLECYALAAAAAIELPIAPEHLPGVLFYLALAADMAALVNGLPLTRDDETGMVFTPVSPEDAR